MNRLKPVFFLFLFFCSNAHGQIISTLAGTGAQGYEGDDWYAIWAQFNCPNNIISGTGGRVYVADFWNGRLRMITPDGFITTVAGNGSDTHIGDGGLAITAGINSPVDMALDRYGNLYIATDSLTDPSTVTYTYSGSYIRKVDTLGIITTIAGNGTIGPAGDNGPATDASFYCLTGIAVDDAGNIFVTDAIGSVRKINTSGIITTVAGNSTFGFSGDGGPATAAQFYGPNDVAVDHSGNLFIADYGNNRIRKVGITGLITTVAGCDSNALFGGDGGPATAAHLAYPSGLTVDDTGNIYIADRANAVVRKVTTAGIISTVAGDNIFSYGGDGGLADTAELSNPMGVAVDSLGNLYIADFGNEDVRKVTAYDASKVHFVHTESDKLLIWPEPNNGRFNLSMHSDLNVPVSFSIADAKGQVVKTCSGITNSTVEVQLNAPAGMYFVTAVFGDEQCSAKILVSK